MENLFLTLVTCNNLPNICSKVSALEMLRLVKIAFIILEIAVIVILIIWMSLDIAKAIARSDVDSKGLFKIVSKRLIATLIVFFIPIIANLTIDIIGSNGNNIYSCVSCATDNRISDVAYNNAEQALLDLESNQDSEHYLIAQAHINKVKEESLKNELQDRLNEYYDRVYASQPEPNNPNPSNPVTPAPEPNSGGVIFVGDSRFVRMCSVTGECGSCGTSECDTDKAIAKTSQGYNYFVNTAIGKVNAILNKNPGKKFTIVIGLGVNDMVSSSYLSKYKDLADSDWKNHKIVVTAIYTLNDGRDNLVQNFNNAINSGISSAGKSNLNYCGNTYSDTMVSSYFDSGDAIHFNTLGSKKLYEVIMNKCL